MKSKSKEKELNLLTNKREREESNSSSKKPRWGDKSSRVVEKIEDFNKNNKEANKSFNKLTQSTQSFLERSRSESKEKDLSENTISQKIINEKARTSQKKDEVIAASKKIFVDELGRVIDEKGNIIPKATNISTLKININKNKEARVKELLRIQRIDQSLLKTKKEQKFYDPLIDQIKKKKEKKKTNAFVFVEKGSFLTNKKKQTAKQLGIDLNKTQLTEEEEKDLLNPDLLPFSNKKQTIKLRAHDLIPDIEWWDSYFLPVGKKSFCPYWEKDMDGNYVKKDIKEIRFEDFNVEDFQKDKITHYIQHPVPVKNEYIEKMNKISLPMFLTKKERKRLRKLRRQEKEKEKQEKMKLGLIEPPKPKLKFNNFMRILSEEAIQDPSKVEKEVRKAYEERYAKMMNENDAKKLTKEQKHEKIRRRFERDIKKECRACLFRIDDLSNKRIKFKIDMNASQLFLTGICININKGFGMNLPNLLLVEGGPLAIKKFKTLMLRRIKWDKKEDKDDEKDLANGENNETTKDDLKNNPRCSLVWEGVLKKRYFEKWKIVEIRTENEARKLLADKGIEHFWNLILSYKEETELKL